MKRCGECVGSFGITFIGDTGSFQKARNLKRSVTGNSNTVILLNKNTSLMQLKSIYFTYSKSLHVSGRKLPNIRRI